MEALPGPDLAAGGRHGLESSRRHSEIRSCSSVVARAAYASISPRVRRRASESEAGPMYRSIFFTPAPRPWKHQKYRYRFPRISFSTKPQPTFTETPPEDMQSETMKLSQYCVAIFHTIGFARFRIDGEVVPSEGLEIEERLRRAGSDDMSVLDDVPEVRDPERLVRVLLDEEEGHPFLSQPPDFLEDLRHGLRREAEAGFVEDEKQRLGHEGAADSDHLLFAAAEADRLDASPFPEAREQAVHVLERLVRLLPRAMRVGPKPEVRFHRELREQPPSFRTRCDSPGGTLVRGEIRDVVPREKHPPTGRPQEAVDHLEDRRLARAVRTDDDGHLALLRLEAHVPQDLGPRVAGIDLPKSQHGPPPFPGTPRSRRVAARPLAEALPRSCGLHQSR